jgi:ABC-type bacteriocin/lantibiotic exporter with double-glycine peptidase domain
MGGAQMSKLPELDATWGKLLQLIAALSLFLSPAHKRQLLVVSLWACGLSVVEMLVAATVIPYVNCLSGQCPAALNGLLQRVQWPSIAVLSVGLFLLICLKVIAQAALAWSGARFNQRVQRDTVSRLLEGYLHLGWMGFRSESRTHYFRRCATTAVDAAYVSHQCVTMISSLLMLLFLSLLMLWQYPLVSVILALGCIALNIVTHYLLANGQKRAAHAREMALQRWNTTMAEAFASFREIRVYGLERFFLQHVDRSIDELAGANVKLNVYPMMPRLVLDFAVLGILLLVVWLWVLLERPLSDLLPQLIFYAVVARVMLPAMMNVLSTRTALLGAVFNIELVLRELERSAAGRTERLGVTVQAADSAVFSLDQVTFRHAPSLPALFTNLSLHITHPSWVAIVGPSGTGKSTLMELLCGVYRPESGVVRHSWPNGRVPSIAYLPQHVALLEGSVAQNVVFGFDEGDAQRVETALCSACLDEVVARLPDGVQTSVGADGAQLSGGERQRLALARALYRRPDLLLLDEATAGLDEVTETRLLANLRRDFPAMSVVYITHRSTSLRFADRLLRLQDGTLADLQAAVE